MSAKMSALPAAGGLTGAELLHLVQGGVNVQSTVAAIVALALGGGATAELIRDTIGSALIAAAGIAVTVNDAGDTITIAADPELIRDTIGACLAAGTGVNGGVVIAVNDAGDTITIGLASSAFLALADAANIDWDMSAGYNAKVTLGGNRTLNTPTNPVEGRTYSLKITQDGTGNRTLAWPAAISFGAAGNPTLSTGVGKIDLVNMQCLESAGPTFRAVFNKSA